MTTPRYVRAPDGTMHGLIPWGGGELAFCGLSEDDGLLEWTHLARGRVTCTECAKWIREVRSLSIATSEMEKAAGPKESS